MYLIDVLTLRLVSFPQARVPPYAILSHRWGKQELNFKDVLKKRADPHTNGYQKMDKACQVTWIYSVRYIWIDTCCIDKRSSAELSEAINSMYKWYEEAKICLAYLEDVDGTRVINDSFTESVWFSRSWTLQELIAPTEVAFYDKDWKLIGDRTSKSLDIRRRTGIKTAFLNKESPLWRCSIAERMSWACDRDATRSEDIAYSLMGIFDVNMPLLHGEGDKAFLRLQEAIIQRASDPSFLAWADNDPTRRLFASRPDDFRYIKNKLITPVRMTTPFTLTNIGLEMEADMTRVALDTYAIALTREAEYHSTLFMFVRQSPTGAYYFRCGVTSSQSHQKMRSKRIVILRGTKEQHEDGYIVGNDTPVHDYAVCVRANSSMCDVLPVVPRKNSTDDFTQLIPETHISGEEKVFRCDFEDPAKLEYTRAELRIGTSKVWYCDIGYEFDSRLCILISKSMEKIHSYGKLDYPTIHKLSDAIDDDHIRTSFPKLATGKMIEVRDSRTGHPYYFLRTHSETSFGITVDDHICIDLLQP